MQGPATESVRQERVSSDSARQELLTASPDQRSSSARRACSAPWFPPIGHLHSAAGRKNRDLVLSCNRVPAAETPVCVAANVRPVAGRPPVPLVDGALPFPNSLT